MKKESLINQEKETIDSNGKRYCFYGRKTGKNVYQAQIQKLVEVVESQAGQDLKPMWDKWQEEMTK